MHVKSDWRLCAINFVKNYSSAEWDRRVERDLIWSRRVT